MIRLADKKDIFAINELGLLLNDEFKNLFNMEEILGSKLDKVFVYEKDNNLLGFLHVIELTDTVDIINITVAREARNQGIASLLMDYMITDVSETVKYFTLEVSENNKCAIALYEKFGFKIINTRKNYYKNANAYLMGREV